MTEAPLDPEAVARVVRMLDDATSVLFVTGAGVSADSGIPTYRGKGGLYDREPTEHGITIEDALSGEMLASRPEVTWKYIHEMERAARGARPNRAHEVIAAIERRIPRTWVLTQNVDGLHAAAGSSKLIEIHGDIRRLRCTACAHEETVRDFSGLADVPRCPACGAVLRPDVVLFGEMLPMQATVTLQRELAEGFDVVFSIGTSSLFPYVHEPVLRAAREGTPTVEIDPGRTDLSDVVTVKLAARAAVAMDAIAKAWRL